jgi:DNA-binding transcriptional regulator PaaX
VRKVKVNPVMRTVYNAVTTALFANQIEKVEGEARFNHRNVIRLLKAQGVSVGQDKIRTALQDLQKEGLLTEVAKTKIRKNSSETSIYKLNEEANQEVELVDVKRRRERKRSEDAREQRAIKKIARLDREGKRISHEKHSIEDALRKYNAAKKSLDDALKD